MIDAPDGRADKVTCRVRADNENKNGILRSTCAPETAPESPYKAFSAWASFVTMITSTSTSGRDTHDEKEKRKTLSNTSSKHFAYWIST